MRVERALSRSVSYVRLLSEAGLCACVVNRGLTALKIRQLKEALITVLFCPNSNTSLYLPEDYRRHIPGRQNVCWVVIVGRTWISERAKP